MQGNGLCLLSGAQRSYVGFSTLLRGAANVKGEQLNTACGLRFTYPEARHGWAILACCQIETQKGVALT